MAVAFSARRPTSRLNDDSVSQPCTGTEASGRKCAQEEVPARPQGRATTRTYHAQLCRREALLRQCDHLVPWGAHPLVEPLRTTPHHRRSSRPAASIACGAHAGRDHLGGQQHCLAVLDGKAFEVGESSTVVLCSAAQCAVGLRPMLLTMLLAAILQIAVRARDETGSQSRSLVLTFHRNIGHANALELRRRASTLPAAQATYRCAVLTGWKLNRDNWRLN